MFGKNSIQKAVHDDGIRLRVVKGSPFRTIQGEGPHAGEPAVFVRLHGCNLACTFCDTNFDDPDDPTIDIYCLYKSINQLFGFERPPLVVITGGEPFRQNILPLIKLIKDQSDAIVQIETAGTLWIDGVDQYAEIVCSPKTHAIHDEIYSRAVAFKYLIDHRDQHYTFVPITSTQAHTRSRRLAEPRPGAPVYLNPLDTYDENLNSINRQLVGRLAMRYGVHAGLQLHKFLALD